MELVIINPGETPGEPKATEYRLLEIVFKNGFIPANLSFDLWPIGGRHAEGGRGHPQVLDLPLVRRQIFRFLDYVIQ